jgi:hypothetical protein
VNVFDEARAMAVHAAARATIEDVTRVLAAEGVRCLALKGTALALDVYPEGVVRMLTDVDVLVPRAAFARATVALRAHGHVDSGPGAHALTRTLSGRASPLPVDLHGDLFSRALFALDTRGVFDRAVPLAGLDAGVERPHGLDLVAHAIGHFAKTRPPSDVHVLGRDISFSMARDALSAEAVAAHLESHGLARAARYALERVRTPEASAIAELLTPDRLAAPMVRLARATEHAPLETVRSVASRHVLNRSLARGVVSFGYHALDALTSRLSRRP